MRYFKSEHLQKLFTLLPFAISCQFAKLWLECIIWTPFNSLMQHTTCAVIIHKVVIPFKSQGFCMKTGHVQDDPSWGGKMGPEVLQVRFMSCLCRLYIWNSVYVRRETGSWLCLPGVWEKRARWKASAGCSPCFGKLGDVCTILHFD